MPDDYLDKFVGAKRGEAEKDAERIIIKRLFMTEDGQYVLGRLLERCMFMEPCDNERDMALNNFAKTLMADVYWDRNKKGIMVYRIIGFVKGMFKRTK